MRLEDAEAMARWLMAEHGLEEWSLEFNDSRATFGLCSRPPHRYIALSRPFIEVNDAAIVRDTILHEIAHALVGEGHTPAWREMAIRIGASHTRNIDRDAVVPWRWIGTCPNGHESGANRRGDFSCGECADTYDPKFKFVWKRVPDGGASAKRR